MTWGVENPRHGYPVTVRIEAWDRVGLWRDISAAVANQVTMIPNLLGRATVKSAKLPFVCPSCGGEEARSIPYQPDAATTHAPKCSACGAKMDFDGFSEEYLPH